MSAPADARGYRGTDNPRHLRALHALLRRPMRDVISRLAKTKRLLIYAYGLDALTISEAEYLAGRLRRRFPDAWRRA